MEKSQNIGTKSAFTPWFKLKKIIIDTIRGDSFLYVSHKYDYKFGYWLLQCFSIDLTITFSHCFLLLYSFLQEKKKKKKKREKKKVLSYTFRYINIIHAILEFDEWQFYSRRKCTFNPYILTFFHFGPYILILPLLVPKPINAYYFR